MFRFTSFKRAAAVAVVAFALLAVMPSASAQTDAIPDTDRDAATAKLIEQGLVQLDSLDRGALLLETDEPGWYIPAPTLMTDFDVSISGPIARTVVSQSFRNVADVFVEGKYLFPLPEGAAVDTLRMRVDDRWIEGQIEEREQARQIYEEARDAGQVASLVEQLRPNAFTTSVANIAPDAIVVVQIEFQQTLSPVDGVFGMRLPLVVAPRYTPSYALEPVAKLGSDGWTVLPSLNEDTKALAAPISPRSEDGADVPNPVTITVDLQAGFPVGDIDSPFHDIDVDRRFESTADVELSGPVPANRDFFLSWAPRELDAPYAETFSETLNNEIHAVAIVTPPSIKNDDEIQRSREVVFVQDTSGSMQGDSIRQARAGLVRALNRLTPDDEFNIIEFNSEYETFASKPIAASEENIRRAVRWVNGLVAEKGTEMFPALEEALHDKDPNDGRLRQVIFLTDGEVTNERDLFALIERDLGKSRLFTVGIGSAPNSYFMTSAARSGRGASVFIGDIGEVQQQMDSLFAKIEVPAVVDLDIEGLPAGATVAPYPIPDLYAGDPVVLTVRMPLSTAVDTAMLTGTRNGDPWELEVELGSAEIRPGVSKLWAREFIRDLEAQRNSATVSFDDFEAIDEQILTTALDFGLVSRLTSLVAVDVEVTRPSDAESTSLDVPLNIPDGWDLEVFTMDQSTPTTVPELSDDALDRLATIEEERVAQSDGRPREPLAYTGVNSLMQLLAGLGLISAGAGTLRFSSRGVSSRFRSSG